MNFETGTYQIKFPDGRFYIGCSGQINQRWSKHLSDLWKGKHLNPHVTDAYAQTGAISFSRTQETTKYDLLFVEANELRAWDSSKMLNIKRDYTFPELCESLRVRLLPKKVREVKEKQPKPPDETLKPRDYYLDWQGKVILI